MHSQLSHVFSDSRWCLCVQVTAGVLLLLLPGCSSKSKDSLPQTKDPVQQFKQLVAEKQSHTVSTRGRYTATFSHLSYDIKKTDSLISPLEAQLSCEYLTHDEAGIVPDYHYRIIAFYAYQDGKWIYKGVNKAFENNPFTGLCLPTESGGDLTFLHDYFK